MKTKLKRCSKCKKRKPLSMFSKNKRNKDGFRFQCKECAKEYRRTHKAELTKHEAKHRKTLVGYLCSRFTYIKQRCNNPNQTSYKNYGGRGIKCLFISSDEFIDYVINKLQVNPFGLAIDRIDNNGHYEPGNIRFVTIAENNKNRKKRYIKP